MLINTTLNNVIIENIAIIGCLPNKFKTLLQISNGVLFMEDGPDYI